MTPQQHEKYGKYLKKVKSACRPPLVRDCIALFVRVPLRSMGVCRYPVRYMFRVGLRNRHSTHYPIGEKSEVGNGPDGSAISVRVPGGPAAYRDSDETHGGGTGGRHFRRAVCR